jgi:hypothetical protein
VTRQALSEAALSESTLSETALMAAALKLARSVLLEPRIGAAGWCPV